MTPGPYLQQFIFFVTYKLAKFGRVLNYTVKERLAKDKHTNLLGPFVSYKEN
jgi:hypothetical protein